jgi:acyl-CoA synthetase (AMP-forming)/AMP-acid ligase II/7-keto-8-aminopelargonate synthetase-like enzyme/acyl carrier protein
MFFIPPDLVELLRHRATYQPEEIAFTFLADGEDQQIHITNKELDRQARAIGGWLQSLGLEGERALLLYPPGLEFIAAFFGCLYAGVVAVPVYPPRKNRSLERIQAIADDAQAKVALTTEAVIRRVEPLIDGTPHLKQLRWLATCQVPRHMEDRWQKPAISRDTLAFLQYTSGSTGIPKGVMLNHGNLLHNSALIAYVFEHTRSGLGVFWLPSYHDMGLIGGILQPLFVGRPNILMSPMAFLQKPYRWLSAISRFRATTSGGPNFAYELCVEKIPPAQRVHLDLSSWQVAFNGAEPVRAETIERFTEAFAPYGFRREAFFPCYGLAEATLIVTGGYAKEPPVIRWFVAEALERGRAVPVEAHAPGARPLVGCGQSLPDQRVIIVDPESCRQLPEGHVGEIWVQGPSVAMGYWNRPEATAATFGGYVRDTGEGPFLRTGDLGFLHKGELFVTGRIKDVIILRGRNVYPQDIELTVQHAHPWLRADAGAAFTVEEGGRERLVVVHEVERRARGHLEPVLQAIRRAVAEEHGLAVDAIVLIKAGTIPKTSSNKIQRHACRQAYQDRTLNSLVWWERSDSESLPPVQEAPEYELATVCSEPAVSGRLTTSTACRGVGSAYAAHAPGCFLEDSSKPDRNPDEVVIPERNWQASASTVHRLADDRDGSHQLTAISPPSAAGRKDSGQNVADGRGRTPATSSPLGESSLPSASGNGDRLAQLVLAQARRLARHRAEEITLDTPISELGLDSLQRMEIVSNLESQLGGRLPPEILPDLETFRDVVSAVERYLGPEKAAAPPTRDLDPDVNEPEKFPEYVKLTERLKLLRAAGLEDWQLPELSGEIVPQCQWGSRSLLNFLTADYLALSKEQSFADHLTRAIRDWQAGSGGSPRSGGRRTVHGQLESALAGFLRAPASLCTASEVTAHAAVFSEVLSPADWVLHEAGYPRSFLMAASAVGAKLAEFSRDDLPELENRLARERTKFRRVILLVQAVSPWDGTLAPLPELLELRRQFRFLLVVEETHSIGTLGRSGRGLAEHFNIDPAEIDLRIGSLALGLSAGGAFLAGKKPLVDLARLASPAFAQEVALSPVLAAVGLAAAQFLQEHPERVAELQNRVRLLRNLLEQKGGEVLGAPEVPLVSLVVGNSVRAIQLAQNLVAKGILCLPIGHPQVKEGRARLRFTCTLAHQEEDFRQLVETLSALHAFSPATAGRFSS